MRIHFIGIGGIGISGLARYLMSKNHTISGSDISQSSSTKALEKLGVEITIPHNAACVANKDLIIHSAIIKDDNVEIIEAKKQNIKVLSRLQAIQFILQDKRVFSVCGAHGKSTISAMLAAIFPTFSAIIGADSKEFGSNVRIGIESTLSLNKGSASNENAKLNENIEFSECVIFEADESDKSFLNSNPYYAIVPNAEPEHMETYGHNLDVFFNAYKEFLNKAKKRIINTSDEFLDSFNQESIRLNPSKDIKNINYELVNDEPSTSFELKNYGRFSVWGFGEHTAQNASLAILCAICELGEQNLEQIRQNLANFKGIKKRFDILQKGKTTIIDDYAHHPTEITATLKSAKLYAKLKGLDKIIAIWQPHKYSRVLDNLDSFVECFKDLCDELVILPVWAAGETFVSIDFEKLFSEYNPIIARRIYRDNDIIRLDSGVELKNALILGLGAGDITYQLRGEK